MRVDVITNRSFNTLLWLEISKWQLWLREFSSNFIVYLQFDRHCMPLSRGQIIRVSLNRWNEWKLYVCQYDSWLICHWRRWFYYLLCFFLLVLCWNTRLKPHLTVYEITHKMHNNKNNDNRLDSFILWLWMEITTLQFLFVSISWEFCITNRYLVEYKCKSQTNYSDY